MMHRRFIAAIAAASIFITSIGAAPARADEDDVARALAIILGLAVIGAAIKDDDDKKRRKPYKASPKKRHPKAYAPYGYAPRDYHPRPLPPRVNRKLLPQECLRSYRTRDGYARIFTRRCLERSYRFVDRLPRECFTRIRTDRGIRHGYGARCLNRRGYALARR